MAEFGILWFSIPKAEAQTVLGISNPVSKKMKKVICIWSFYGSIGETWTSSLIQYMTLGRLSHDDGDPEDNDQVYFIFEFPNCLG